MWQRIKIAFPKMCLPLDLKRKKKLQNCFWFLDDEICDWGTSPSGAGRLSKLMFTGCISAHKSLLVKQCWELSGPMTSLLCVAMLHLNVVSPGTKQQISQTNKAQTGLGSCSGVCKVQCIYICILAQNLHLLLFFNVTFMVEIITGNLWWCSLAMIFVLHLEGGPLFHSVFNILQRKRQQGMDEAWETFIGWDGSCDSLELRFSGAVCFGVLHTESLDDGAWMQGREEFSCDRRLCLIAGLFANSVTFSVSHRCTLFSLLLFSGHMRLWHPFICDRGGCRQRSPHLLSKCGVNRLLIFQISPELSGFRDRHLGSRLIKVAPAFCC